MPEAQVVPGGAPRVDLPVTFYRWAWRSWLAAFVALETAAILDPKPGDTLTENTRPAFLAHPLLWFLGAGFLSWLWVHFLTPRGERALLDLIR